VDSSSIDNSNFAILNLYYNAAYRTRSFVCQALNILAYFPAYLVFGVAACLALHVAYLALGIATHHWSYLVNPCVTFYYFYHRNHFMLNM
jgi:hypothetical protein